MQELLLMLLISAGIIAAQVPSAAPPDPIATYTATLHERINPSCELIRAARLIQYNHYVALAFAGAEIYSPELGKDDFIALRATVPKDVAKATKKAGFSVREEPSQPPAPDKPIMSGTSCLVLQQAIAEADHQRHERRAELQTRLQKIGFDVLPPTPIDQVQPESAAGQDAVQHGTKPAIKKGTTMLQLVVGVDGKVHDVHIVRSLDVTLDHKALDAVQQWTFLPARLKGLPVPVEIVVEVNFRLD